MVWMYRDKQLNISIHSKFQSPCTFDQPLFTLAKLIQWKWLEIYGELMHVVMIDGLHNAPLEYIKETLAEEATQN